jgi:ornithine--oxo-acid transaminase
VAADADVLGVLTAGSHGSTFGGNPLACAVGREVLALLREGDLTARAARLGDHLATRLAELAGADGSPLTAVRVRGPWAGIDFGPPVPSGRAVCEGLLARGVLAKDTHGRTIRLAPPLVIGRADLDLALDHLADVVGAH